MNIEEFEAYAAEGYNRIPLVKTLLADTDTPLSAFMKLAKGPYTYLFESVEGGEKWGRYSIIGLSASERVEISGKQVKVIRDKAVVEAFDHDEPLAFVRDYQARFKALELDTLPSFSGGLVGYFGYDTARMIEPRLQGKAADDTLQVPDILLMVSDELVVFDNLRGKLHLICNVDPGVAGAFGRACERLDQLADTLAHEKLTLDRIEAVEPSGITQSEQRAKHLFPKADFLNAVDRIKDYILDGDTMQVVLSQRMVTEFDAQPINLYRALRSLNPSPYMYFMNLDEVQIVGSSPEILAKLRDSEVTVRPIAGTRRRGYTEAEDRALEQELINDPKEIAEHLMLIDLGRNDVGRISKTGSVELTQKMIVERFSHVLHITSNVVGEIADGGDAVDVIKATHPAGTLSGAPKIRAMEIIDQLEPCKRSIYGGAIGYLGWNGSLDLAIAIRTAVIKDKQVYIQAGAGVVADSVAELEWKETLNKARALFSAIDWVS